LTKKLIVEVALIFKLVIPFAVEKKKKENLPLWFWEIK
jgi:hypothetical protein